VPTNRTSQPGEPQYTWVFSTVLGNAIVVWKKEAVLVIEFGHCYIHFKSVQLTSRCSNLHINRSVDTQKAERRIRSRYAPSGFNSLGLAVKS
jgi:hypothetical protein